PAAGVPSNRSALGARRPARFGERGGAGHGRARKRARVPGGGAEFSTAGEALLVPESPGPPRAMAPWPCAYGSGRAGAPQEPRNFVDFGSSEKIARSESNTGHGPPGAQSRGPIGPMACAVRISTRRVPPPAPRRARSRFGYDHRWWGEPA